MPRPCSRCGGTIGAGAGQLCAACLLRLAALPEALAPEYEIETLLGSGRAGTTYLARALDSGALLAVKIIVPRPTTAAGEEGGDVPALAGALRVDLMAFQHPGVARTHAVDLDAEGNLRIVRDYVAGKPLSGWTPTADAAHRRQAFEGIAAAIDAAHARSLFHGHVAASNVIIGSGGRPVLVDLGAYLALHALQAVSVSNEEMAQQDRAGLEGIRAELMAPP